MQEPARIDWRIARVLEVHALRLDLELDGQVDGPEYQLLFETEQALLDELTTGSIHTLIDRRIARH